MVGTIRGGWGCMFDCSHCIDQVDISDNIRTLVSGSLRFCITVFCEVLRYDAWSWKITNHTEDVIL